MTESSPYMQIILKCRESALRPPDRIPLDNQVIIMRDVPEWRRLYEVGDIVEIISTGYIYSSYRAAHVACGIITSNAIKEISNYNRSLPAYVICRVVGMALHERGSINHAEVMYGVVQDSVPDYMMLSPLEHSYFGTVIGEKGIKFVRKAPKKDDLISDELFSI